MEASLQNHRVLFFVGDCYEDLELWYPLYRLQEAGAQTVIAGETLDCFAGKNGYAKDRGYDVPSALSFNELLERLENERIDFLVKYSAILLLTGTLPDEFSQEGKQEADRILKAFKETGDRTEKARLEISAQKLIMREDRE